MPDMFTTSSPVQAAVRGFLLAGLAIAFLWLLELPLDWKFVSIVAPVVGISAAIRFYDGNKGELSRASPVILMRNVHWDFATTTTETIDGFIATVNEAQGEQSEWNPEQRVVAGGPVEIHFALFHRETEPDERIVIQHHGEGDWTQSRLLHALHQKLNVESLGDHTFFEGLAVTGEREFRLLLGS